jgi:ubiquinone/menaquinone biosynthesis C-methylase UbiE
VAGPSFTLDERAEVDFVLALRKRWADTLYPTLTRQVEATGTPARDWREAEPLVHAQPVYPWFAWAERGAQKMMWRTMTRLVRRQGTGIPPPPDRPVGRLDLDPDLRPPAYYTDWDIHIQPGGLWGEDEAALVYEQGAKVVMLGENDDYAFHTQFARAVAPERPYRRIVDLGCGFGKSTRPFKAVFPDAEVIGVDLAAPVLRLAHAQAEAQGLAIVFRQADLTETGLEAGSADLVTATMVIHELPRHEQAAMLREAARLLAPGGLLRILDFHPTGEPVRDLAMREHGVRNNEPFMPVLFDHDVVTVCTEAGLTGARWVAFDERGAGRLDGLSWPERREWHFPWAVLEAEQPS